MIKYFSKIITESVNSDFAITQDEYDEYSDAICKTKRTKEFTNLLWLVKKYAILFDKENFEKLLKGKTLDEKIISIGVQKDIVKLCKKIGDEVKLLPQLLTAEQRQLVIDNKIDPNDLTIDLETQKGRDIIAKRYISLIEKLVRQYKNKSSLSDEELRSAAYLGLTNAMNEYKNPEELKKSGKEGKMSFTNYAAYRIQQQILNDMNNYSRNVHISDYYQKQIKTDEEGVIPSEVSLDKPYFGKDDDEAYTLSNYIGFSTDDEQLEQKEKEQMYKKLFARIESKFSLRDCNFLYKTFGVNGQKQEKVKDIAREYNISSPAVTQAVTRIIKFMSTDSVCKSIKHAFESLIDDYIINKALFIYDKPKDEIIESFLYDDIYMIIESVNRFSDRKKFEEIINKATDFLSVNEALFIYDVIRGVIVLDEKQVKKHRAELALFLENVYPENAYKKESAENIINTMNELKDIAIKFKIKW